MAEIINEFNSTREKVTKSGKNLELEIRFNKLTIDKFVEVYNKFSGQYTPEISLQIDTRVPLNEKNAFGNRIRHQEYAPNSQKVEKIKDVYTEKRQVKKRHDLNGATLNLSLESPIDSFPITGQAMVRLKLRASFALEIPPKSPKKWSLDLTAILEDQLDKIGPRLEKLKEELFKGTGPKNFLEKIKTGPFKTFEMELECKFGPETPITMSDVEEAQIFVSPNLIKGPENAPTSTGAIGTSRPQIMATIAKKLGLPPNVSFKMLLSRVIQLNKKKYQGIWPLNDTYLIGEKADGARTVIYVEGPNCYILGGNTFDIVQGPETATTIIDCELIAGQYYIFDMMWFEGKNVMSEPFSARNKMAGQVTPILNKFGLKTIPKLFERCPAEPGPGLKKIIEGNLHAKRAYEVDGLIIVRDGDNYWDTQTYKWKPASHLSIDFLARKLPSNILGQSPYVKRPGFELYLLFSGITRQDKQKFGLETISIYKNMFPDGGDFMPIQFTTSSHPYAYIYYYEGKEDLDGKIVELAYDGAQNSTKLGGSYFNESPVMWNIINWKFLRIREDRSTEKNYFGNYYTIAVETFNNYINPFPEQELWGPNFGYFEIDKDDRYWAQRAYNRMVINNIFKKHVKGAKFVSDLAAGRGADLGRYEDLGVKALVCVDIDKDAISELISRQFNNKRHGGMSVYVTLADLKDKYAQTMEKIKSLGFESGQFDVIVCNFAIHYMCDSSENIINFIKLVDNLLKKGGKFIYTTFDGKNLFEQIGDQDKLVFGQDNVTGGPPKYVIERRYQGPKFTGLNQKIALKLAFTTELREEPLCDIKYVNKLFKMEEFTQIDCGPFSGFKDIIREEAKNIYEKMTEDDFKFVGLYTYVVLAKK